MKRLIHVIPAITVLVMLTTGATWPLSPEPPVVHAFDPPASRWGPGHRGVDLAGRAGQPVRAAAAGRVAHAAGLAGRGTVTVTHGAIRTTYEPVSPLVSRGDEVTEGQVIGHLQVVGSHCFPRSCLHWGALRGETYLDPLVLVGAGPVRLMPLGGLPRSTPVVSPTTLMSSMYSMSSMSWLALRLAGVPGGMPSAIARW